MQTIDAKALQEKACSGDDLLLINTLDPEHFDKTHIPCSINVPESDDNFVDEVGKIAGRKDREIVVYCANEACNSSPQAAQKLTEAGFTNVKDFEAGAEGWKEAGLELAT